MSLQKPIHILGAIWPIPADHYARLKLFIAAACVMRVAACILALSHIMRLAIADNRRRSV